MDQLPPSDVPFWDRPEVVEFFAGRPPDRRLVARLGVAPTITSVLDIGCAGGRNCAHLAERGFDVWAVDTSDAMLSRTRERVARALGEQEAAQRVVRASMTDLGMFPPGRFDLVVALGVLQAAGSEAAWHRAAAEAARVLRPGGELLLSHFSPDTDPSGAGEGLTPVPGQPHAYSGFGGERSLILLHPDELDAWMGRHRLVPLVPTASVRVPFRQGFRTTVNAHYRRLGPAKASR